LLDFGNKLQAIIKNDSGSIHILINRQCGLKSNTSVINEISMSRGCIDNREILNKLNAHLTEINSRYDPVTELKLNEDFIFSIKNYAVPTEWKKGYPQRFKKCLY